MYKQLSKSSIFLFLALLVSLCFGSLVYAVDGVQGFLMTTKVLSDNTWKSYDTLQTCWETPGFDDSGWRNAYAPYPNKDHPTAWIPDTEAIFMWDYPDHSPTVPNGTDGPCEAWFRKTFTLDCYPSNVVSASVVVGADDDFDFYVNGVLVHSDWDGIAWSAPFTIDIKPYLVKGENVFAMYAKDSHSGHEWALVDVTIEWKVYTVMKVLSDNTWKSYDTLQTCWETPGFDDSGWRNAYAPYPNKDHPTAWIPDTEAIFMWDYPDHSPTVPNGTDGPCEAWFRKTFTLDCYPSNVVSASVVVGADDDFDFYVNGVLVHSDWDGIAWSAPFTIDIKPYLVKGENVFAMYAKDSHSGHEWALVDVTIETSVLLVNDMVDFTEPPHIVTSLFKPFGRSEPWRYGCPDDCVGYLGFGTRLDNLSNNTLSNLEVRVDTLTNDNLLILARGDWVGTDVVGAGTVGEGGHWILPTKNRPYYGDGKLGPGEFDIFTFHLCLKSFERFSFYVDLLGTVK